MIIGVGLDVVQVSRLERWMANPKLLERFFHPREISDVLSRGKGAVRSLAVRFAAKEAFGKALGTGLEGLVLKDIMVVNSDKGKPELELTGTAGEALRKSGAARAHISLSHERDIAAAVVVLEANS
jgi:holo-[acyl-carrier protein] synthase